MMPLECSEKSIWKRIKLRYGYISDATSMKTKVMEVETSGYCSRIGTIWNKVSKTIDTLQKTLSILTSGILCS